MLIERDEVIAGLPAAAARDVMRELTRRMMSPGQLERRLADAGALDPTESLKVLCDTGLLEVTDERADYLTTTVAGTALAKARIGKAMTRAKAEQLLGDVLERVRDVNDDSEALWWVETVELFGSLADLTRSSVGDVDLRIVLTPRYDKERQFELTKQAARESGRRFNTLIDELGYASFEMYRRIRGKSNRVDIQFDHNTPSPLPDGATTIEKYRRTN